MRKVRLGDVEVSRLIIGGNPFSGFSHQSPERDLEMVHFYTTEKVKEALRKAEEAGINTFIGRSDKHIKRILLEYWDEGGTIQWFAQTSSEFVDQIKDIKDVAAWGATGVYVHGGNVDYWFIHREYDMIELALKTMRECGVVAGLAGHSVEAHTWIRDNLKPDFQMCSYYDTIPRTVEPHHVSNVRPYWDDSHPERMVKLIHTLRWPAVHYKVFAGGNRPIRAGFEYLARSMRENDLVCIGHYLGDNPNMIAENVEMFDKIVEKKAGG